MEYNARFLGRMLKYARETMRMTQPEAAEHLNLSISYYKKLEIGINTPSLPCLYDVLEFLNMSADSVLYPSEDRISENDTYHQTTRLLQRCNEAELDMFYHFLDAYLASKDKVPAVVDAKSISEIYADSLIETMDKKPKDR